MPSVTINPSSSVSGQITFAGTYSGSENVNPQVVLSYDGLNITSETRTFIDYDVRDSVTLIPSSARISSIDLLSGNITETDTPGFPDGQKIWRFECDNDRIQGNTNSGSQIVLAALYGDAGWEGLVDASIITPNNTVITFGDDALNVYNQVRSSGLFSIRIKDVSSYSIAGTLSTIFRILSNTRWRLRINYDFPTTIRNANLKSAYLN